MESLSSSSIEATKCFLQQLSKNYWNYEPVTVSQGDMTPTKQDLKESAMPITRGSLLGFFG